MRRAFCAVLLATAAMTAMADPPKPPVPLRNGMGPVTFLRFSPSGRELVRICQFGGVEVFDTDGYGKLRTFPVGMRMISFSPDGTRIATAEGTHGARAWDATQPGKRLPKTPEFGPNEVFLLETPLRVLQAPSSEGANSNTTRQDKQRVFRVEFSPDGKRLLMTRADGLVRLWNADTWVVEAEVVLSESELRAAAFAPDGASLVVGGVDGVLHEWDVARKTEVGSTHGPGAVVEIVYAPDGKSLVTVHQSKFAGSVVFWDATRRAVETKEGWSSVAISKDGKTMAIGGPRVEFVDPVSRKTIRAVDLPAMTMGEANARFADGPDAGLKLPVSVVALAFSPDGATLAAGCQDGSVRFVPVAP